MAKQGKKREPGIMDVIYEVNIMDSLQKNTPEYTKVHEKVVGLVQECNLLFGPGWTSISKTRSLIQYMRLNECGIYKPEKEDKTNKWVEYFL